MFCREQSARLASRHDEIRARGAALYAIGNGTVPFARAFREEMPASFPLFTDPSRQSYRAFGMRRRAVDFLKPSVLFGGHRAIRAGFHQTAVRGDALQNGGVVIVGTDGRVLYRHVESAAGDLADLDDVLAALERA